MSQGSAEEVLYEQTIQAYPTPIIVPVNFDGQATQLILDTGCHCHVIDATLRRHFGTFQRGSASTAFGIRGDNSIYESPKMSMGIWKLPHSTLFGSDFGPFRMLLGVGVDGLLSVNGLGPIAIDVDFDRERIRFIREFKVPEVATLFSPGKDQGGRHRLPAIRTESVPIVIRQIIDGLTVNAEVDTGSFSTMTLRAETFTKLLANGTISQNETSDGVWNQTLAGVVRRRAGYFMRGSLLGVDLKGMPVEDGGDMDTLGMPFLINFNFVYDGAARMFYFERRRTEPPIDPDSMLGTGLIFPDGQCRVFNTGQKIRGPAKSAGLEENDVILKLGRLHGKDLNRISVYDLCERLAGQKIDVEYLWKGDGPLIKTRLRLSEKRFVYPQVP